MSDYRRWLVPGATYFFAVVTYGRRRIFESEAAVHVLGDVMRGVRQTSPWRTIAMVVLPDHLHCVWSLPLGDPDFSTRWRKIKRDFTLRWIKSGGTDAVVSVPQHSRGEHGIWQRRFWEHQVRDEADLEHCCDYIHYNPVKHGYATRPSEWPWSTYARFVDGGDYPPDWGATLPASLKNDVLMGE
jgi:putative transposase